MRKKFFRLAVAFLILGLILIYLAWPTVVDEGTPVTLRKDLFGPIFLKGSYFIFGLAGLSLLAGFIIQSPKETTSKSPPEEN